MKKLKLSEFNLGNVEVLTREQLKRVLGGIELGGGSGSYCECYCCEDGPGSCGSGNPVPGGGGSCSTNEECQDRCIDAGASCPEGWYVAALCLG